MLYRRYIGLKSAAGGKAVVSFPDHDLPARSKISTAWRWLGDLGACGAPAYRQGLIPVLMLSGVLFTTRATPAKATAA